MPLFDSRYMGDLSMEQQYVLYDRSFYMSLLSLTVYTNLKIVEHNPDIT